MPQKYKFFIKQSVVMVGESGPSDPSDVDAVNSVIQDLARLRIPSVQRLYVKEPEAVLSQLKERTTHVIAGGGYVLAPSGELLMIHRRGHWDLPKGKAEHGESIEQTALREVEEECGIGRLRIASEPFSTFHLYEERGTVILKESVWFKMEAMERATLVPQTEEDITSATWMELPIAQSITSAAYPSILEVLGHFSQ